MTAGVELRRCSRCGEKHELEEYRVGRRLAAECPACRSERSRIYYEKNADQVRARANAYYHANREKRLRKKAQYREERRQQLAAEQREYRVRHLDERREYDHAYYAGNAEKLRERTRQWRRANPAKARALRRHHGRLRRFGKDAATVDYAEVLGRDVCAYCGDAAEHKDHIEPVGRGGAPTWHNLTAACKRCNQAKHTTSLLFFLLRIVNERGEACVPMGRRAVP